MEPNRQLSEEEKKATVLMQLAMETPATSRTTPQHLVGAKCVYISKQDVFEQALQILSLELHEAKALVVGNGQTVGFVCIDVPAHGEYPMLPKKMFFGDYKLTEDAALESEKLAALIYLQEEGIIVVDDINLGELAKREAQLDECQRRLMAASAWAILFQERAEALKVDLDAARTKAKILVSHTPESAFTAERFPLHPTSSGTGPLNLDKERGIRGPRASRTLFKK